MIEEIAERLQGRNLSEVARRAGMAYKTVFALANGKRHDIYTSTYTTLNTVMDRMDKEAEKDAG
jgi:hypothetical protein